MQSSCDNCGYDLRGQGGVHRCPECGSDFSSLPVIGRTASRRRLRNAYIGCLLQLSGIALALALGLLAAFASNWIATRVYVLGKPALTAITACAIFLVTVQDPRVAFVEGAMSWRRLLRLGALIVSLATALCLVSPGSFLAPLRMPIAVLANCMGAILLVAEAVWLRGIACELHLTRLAAQTAKLAQVLAVTCVMGGASLLISTFSAPNKATAAVENILRFMQAMLVLASIVGGGIVLFRFARELKRLQQLPGKGCSSVSV